MTSPLRLFALALFSLATILLLASGRARADEDEPRILPEDGYVHLVNGMLMLQEEPAESRQPETGRQPESTSDILSLAADRRGGGLLEDLRAAEQAQLLPSASGAPKDAVSPTQQAAPPLDLVGALQQSDTIQTVNNQLRNPVSLDPRVRGYRYAQIYTQGDGAFFLPVRQDLDTPLSMFDPSVVQTIEAVAGPYSLQYGPGFSYLNVVTAPTPRYDCYESHAFVGTTYYGNGDLLNATQRFYGGNKEWGFSILHATRDGNAYRAGDGTHIPAAYNNEDLFAQFGFNLDTDRRVEFRYLRQDQVNTQYPAQFWQTNAAVDQGFNLQYVDQSVEGPWDKLVLEGWYNIGRLHGSTNPNENTFQVVQRVDVALVDAGAGPNPNFAGTTNAGTYSTGGRLATVYGQTGERQLTVGTDFRLINQYVNENLAYNDVLLGPQDIHTGLPRSYMTDPGVFGELILPVASYWTATLGTRVDWIHSDLFGSLPANYPDQLGTQLAQNNVLYSFFLTNKIELDDNWQARLSAGQAQRPPSLTERYADGEFLAIIQSGFSRVIGLPTLPPERLWQLDASLNCNYECFRGRLSGYYSFIQNFSTFQAFPIIDPTGARLLFTLQTPLATLAGFEAYGERDLSAYWTAFASGLYVDGRDQTLGAPLTQIYPLEGRAGLRLHDPDGGNRWGVEMLARVVDRQDRLGTLRTGFFGDQRVVIELPTGGFTVCNLRSYWNVSKRFNIVAGINNVFDRNYLEHLSLRFQQSNGFPAVAVLSPGFNPYVGVNWTY
jgi:outer membrane receptor protein involved in Fe transport